jgi:hypothetical protein
MENAFSGLTAYYAIIIVAAAIYQLVAAAFTAWLAAKKGYDFLVWFFLGLLFGLIPLFAIGLAPVKRNPKKFEQSVSVDTGPQNTNHEQTSLVTDEKTDFIPMSLGKFADKIVLYRSPAQSADVITVNEIARTIELNKIEGKWLNLRVNKEILGWAHIPEYKATY